jgi:hypothetical protein
MIVPAPRRSSSVSWAMKPERVSPAAPASASRRRSTRRGSEMFTRSIVSSSKAGSSVRTPKAQPAWAGSCRNASRRDGGGIASPASSAASIQAAAASSAPENASSRLSPAEKQPGRSGTTIPNALSSSPGSMAMG